MHTPSPESPIPDVLLFNPFKKGSERSEQEEQSEQAPPDDRSVIGALLGEGAAEDFTALLPHQEQEIPPKADLPGGELALSAEEVARVNAREREQTLEQQARAWFLGLGKDEEWIEKHFTFEDGITCIAETLDLSNCKITELPSFFGKIKEIKNLNLIGNLLTTLHNIPKEIKEDLWIEGNPNLTSCAGFRKTTVGGTLYLSHNPVLASCVGLEEATIKGSLWLNKNPRLASLKGLPPKENLKIVLFFSEDQKHLIQEAREKGYKIHIIT